MWKAFISHRRRKWCSFNFFTVARSVVPIFGRAVGSHISDISFRPQTDNDMCDFDFRNRYCSWPPSLELPILTYAELNVYRIIWNFEGTCIYYAIAEPWQKQFMEVGEDLLWLTVKGVQVQRGCKSQDWILGVAAGNRSYIVAAAWKQGHSQATTHKAFALTSLCPARLYPFKCPPHLPKSPVED